MDSIVRRVRDTIEKHSMLQEGDRVLVALSGGPDSVFLLHALRELGSSYKLSLHLAHLDHQLRGRESEEDREFVRDIGRDLGVPCTVESFNLPAYLEERGVSVEEGGRRVRYEFLDRVADQVGAQRIALGHTANDQAETFLLRLIRGAGKLGLGSIPPKRGRIIRPTIEIAKGEIIDWLASHEVPYRIDSTNLTESCSRNLVRTRLLPQLLLLNPHLIETLRRTAEILREEEEFLNSLMKQAVPKVVTRRDGDEVLLDLKGLFDYNIAMRRRFVREAILELKGDLLRVSFRDVDSVLELCRSGKTGSRLDLPSVTVEKGYGELILRRTQPEQRGEFEKELLIPGITALDSGLRIDCKLVNPSLLPVSLDFENRAYFDFGLLAPPLVVRSRRKGDRFIPFGLKRGSKSLKELFVEEKVRRSQRSEVPILADREGVLWVVGCRRSDRAKIGPATREVLVVERL